MPQIYNMGLMALLGRRGGDFFRYLHMSMIKTSKDTEYGFI